MCYFIKIYVFMILIVCIWGHGRLMEPPARNSMWRFGFNSPVNYNDNELFCGGATKQHVDNKGKCGICGDDAADPVPRDHEAGGKYGLGILTRFYHPGQVIPIIADITANHWGYLGLKLCPNNNPRKIITQQCLDRYPLPVIGGNGTKFIIPKDSKRKEVFKYDVQLPYITCSHCVIQWTYYTGNTWGICKDNKTEEVGCGPQETFINCADVAIVTSAATLPKPKPMFRIYVENNNLVEPLVVKYDTCMPTKSFSMLPGMNRYCKQNCMKYPPYCPDFLCSCYSDCYAVGEFAKKYQSDIYCNQVCLRYPPDCKDCGPVCPKTRCVCTP